MRKFLLYVLCSFLLAGLLAGCAAFKTEFRNKEGVALDHPYGEERAITRVVAKQAYREQIAVSIDGGSATVYEPGDPIKYKMTSKKTFTIRVWWGDMIGYDGKLKEESHPRVGLWTGEPIIIDEFFLRNWARLEIVIKNIGNVPLTLADVQDNDFILGALEEKTLFVVDGKYILTWRGLEQNRYLSRKTERYLAPGHKVPWGTRSVDAVFLIDGSNLR